MHEEERVGWINLRFDGDRLHLVFRISINDGDWEDVVETVRIVRVACRFGGTRPYFLCPGHVKEVACSRRVEALFAAGRYFLCRHCYRLAHSSQSEGAVDRAIRRTNKIRQRLGGDPGLVQPFPDRPTGMWRRTYERLSDRAMAAEVLADQALAIRTERLLARFDNQERKGRFWR